MPDLTPDRIAELERLHESLRKSLLEAVIDPAYVRVDALAVVDALPALLAERERLRAERDEAREAHARVVRLIQRSTGMTDLGLLCECGHMHIADEDSADAGCRICECSTFDRTAPEDAEAAS